jgi:UDP-N-acetyl-D-glucosamine dehydrogenase
MLDGDMGPDTKKQLLERIGSREAVVGIIGQGYVGLPLALTFAEAGFRVIGFDLDEAKVAGLNRGESHIKHVGTDRVAKAVAELRFSASADFGRLTDCDAILICVPTPLGRHREPDMSFVHDTAKTIRAYLRPGQLVTLESTTYPGTTDEEIKAILEESGLATPKDFFLAFSPERVDPGRTDWTTINTPKVMGGITETCSQIATIWYSQSLKTVVPVTSAEAAEMAKLLENTFRMINIGLVNEMALMCERLGVDVWEVIDAAATKPFGFMKFTPGPGLGGHCIPIDPLYLSWKLKALNYTARFIELASEINGNMPRHTVSKIQDALNEHRKPLKGSKCLVLGAAYKPDVDDLRESPALDVIGLLDKKGALVSYHDPFIKHLHTHDDGQGHRGVEMDSVPDLMAAVREADIVVIVTNHSSYDYPAILEVARLIFDSRNAFGKIGNRNPKVFRL